MGMITFEAAVLSFIQHLAEDAGSTDTSLQKELAHSISGATSDFEEAETLSKIARWESGFDPKVANCKIKSSRGAVSLFQIMPKDKEHSLKLCSSIDDSAKEALSIIRTAKDWCAPMGYKGADLLEPYVRGKCGKATMLSKMRYGKGDQIKKFMDEG